MTFKELAAKVAELEGGKKNLNIAEVSEVVKCTLSVLKTYVDENGVEGLTAVTKLIGKAK